MAEYPAPYLEFVRLFNERRFRACVDPLEVIWLAQRDDFHKALIRMCVGLNQIGLGLESGPRFLLQTARELLVPYGTWHQGLDIATLLAFLDEAEATLDTVAPRVVPLYILELKSLAEPEHQSRLP